MTDVDDIAETVDGRVARRQRNVDAVLDVVLEMFGEDAMFPTIEQVSDRSGLSLRSMYRYFADPGELVDAAIKRSSQIGRELSRLHAVGQGPLDRRVDDFVSMRLELYEAIGPVFRATLANAARHACVRDQLAVHRNEMREQFELQFARELAARKRSGRETVLSAGDLLTQLDSVDFLRRHRQLTVAETHATITTSLRSLLG